MVERVTAGAGHPVPDGEGRDNRLSGPGALAMTLTDAPLARLGVSDPRTWPATERTADAIPHLAYGLLRGHRVRVRMRRSQRVRAARASWLRAAPGAKVSKPWKAPGHTCNSAWPPARQIAWA